MRGVILYGPPAAGKDTVTRALSSLSAEYVLFQRLKVGGGRTSGYRMTTLSLVNRLHAQNDVLWANERYDAVYVVDRPSLREMLAISIPVLHLGQTKAVNAITGALPAVSWTTVYLWCPRDVARRRIIERRTGDVPARMHAWDETKPLTQANLSLNTAEVSPEECAYQVHEHVREAGNKPSDNRPVS